MLSFGHRHSNNWHQQIQKSAEGRQPVLEDFLPNPLFPWDTLRSLTDLYLLKKKAKKNELLTREQITDSRVSSLIEKHANKVVAIASAGHLMAPRSVRLLLIREFSRIESVDYFALCLLLEAMVVANFVNAESVCEQELQKTRTLLFASRPDNSSPELLAQTLINGAIPTEYLVSPYIYLLAHKTLTDFSNKLEELRKNCSWSAARACSAWLADVYLGESSGHDLVKQRLDAASPNWRAWAVWKPDFRRTMTCKSSVS